jgi:hypothetical protein
LLDIPARNPSGCVIFKNMTRTSKFTNWLASRLTGLHLHDYGCTLKTFRRDVIGNINLYGEIHRCTLSLASWMAVSIAEVNVKYYPRIHGVSKNIHTAQRRILIIKYQHPHPTTFSIK